MNSRTPLSSLEPSFDSRICGDDRSIRRAHFIGAGGAGMRSLARLMREQGWRITGSDASESIGDPTIRVGHHPENVPPDAQLVVVSDAVPSDNCERLRAAELGLPTLSYAETLGRLSRERWTIAVAGAHGKSTTCAMLADVLRAAGRSPSVVMGAETLNSNPKNVFLPSRDSISPPADHPSLIVEACEFNRNFLHLRPSVGLILSVEPDHFDSYVDEAALRAAFAEFARRIPDDGCLIVNGDCPAALAATSGLSRRRILFGEDPACDWRVTDVSSHNGRYQATFRGRGQQTFVVRLRLLGRHNVQNALAATATADQLGVPKKAIIAGLSNFLGVRRRLEIVATLGGVQFVDDYAHHPTEIAAGLGALREMTPQGRLWLLLQPHQLLRTERLLESMAAALSPADRVLVAPVFPAREPWARPAELTEISRRLTARAQALGVDAVFVDETGSSWKNGSNLAEWVSRAIGREQWTPGGVVVAMGAGNIGKVIYDVSQRFRKDCQVG